MIHNIIFSLLFFIGLDSYAIGLPMKGLACHDTDPWTESEKTRFKGKLLADNITKFFFLPSQAYIKKDDFCAYKSENRSFMMGFKEKNNDEGKIIFMPPVRNTIQEYDHIIWVEYGVYAPDYTNDKFREMFRLKHRNRNRNTHPGLYFPASAKHIGYFWHLDYMPFMIVIYDNKEKHLFAMKVRPK